MRSHSYFDMRACIGLTGADVGGHGGRPPGPIGGRGPPGGGPPLIGPPGPYMCGGGGPLKMNKVGTLGCENTLF